VNESGEIQHEKCIDDERPELGDNPAIPSEQPEVLNQCVIPRKISLHVCVEDDGIGDRDRNIEVRSGVYKFVD